MRDPCGDVPVLYLDCINVKILILFYSLVFRGYKEYLYYFIATCEFTIMSKSLIRSFQVVSVFLINPRLLLTPSVANVCLCQSLQAHDSQFIPEKVGCCSHMCFHLQPLTIY